MAPLPCRIAIIGAGVSGIAAAKQLAHHNPVVFEATDCIGGVWKHCSYGSTRLQSLRCDYEFSDFPWPDRDNSSFPTHGEILDYLTQYVHHFDLLKFVMFNSKVVALRFLGDSPVDAVVASPDDAKSGEYGKLLPCHPVWEIAVQNSQSHAIQLYEVEMVVMCIGKYGDVPKIPEFPKGKGPEIFEGKVMHSLDYCKLGKEEAIQLLKGKKVAVIGYKKSAIDLVMECVQANQGPDGKPCTMVVRGLHWTVPHYWIWGLPFFLFFSTRSSQFLHERPNQSFLKTLICLFLSPMRYTVSKFIESYLTWKFPLRKYGLKPEHPFIEDYASCQMAIMPENFFRAADNGYIIIKKALKWWFWEGGIQFEDNSCKSEFDLVILATGFDGKKKLRDIFPHPFCSFLEYPSDMMPLYRGTINPMIPNVGFVGYLESVANLHTAELRSIWLARLADEKFKLPEIEKMLEKINKEMDVMKRTTRFYKRHCISTYSINHSDEICEEMGWEAWRKNTWFSEAFSPYGSEDYNDHDHNLNHNK